jgi:hypothetical protein
MHESDDKDQAMGAGMLTAGKIIADRAVQRIDEDAEYDEAGVSGARKALLSDARRPG